MKTDEIKETVDTLLNIGPWTALSIIAVCALACFIFISLRAYFLKGNSKKDKFCDTLDKVEARQEEMYKDILKRQDKMYSEIMDVKTEVAYISGTLNGKRHKKEKS